MGRWSRTLAAEFVAWLSPQPKTHWLEIGCGTGALTQAIVADADPESVTACDTAASFTAYCDAHLRTERVRVVTIAPGKLPSREGGYDFVVSSLVLNFLPEPVEALRQMRSAATERGCVAAAVWDYSSGMEFLRLFWDAAVELDPNAARLHEGARFPICRPQALRSAFAAAQLEAVVVDSVTVPTVFESFDDYWTAFLDGPGPAPTYLSAASEKVREQLEERLRKRLGGSGGRVRLAARAWLAKGVRGVA